MEKNYIIIIAEGFWYDDETFIEAGDYEFEFEGINAYPMMKVNGEWLDLCALEELPYVDIVEC